MNWPTMIVACIIAVIFVSIIYFEIKKRKSGKGSCSCGCSGCGMADVCHGQKETKE